MFAQINELIKVIDDAVWGLPLICLIMVTGILLTVRLGGVQVRHLGKAFKFMFQDEEDGHGEVTSLEHFVLHCLRPSEREISQVLRLRSQQVAREHYSGWLLPHFSEWRQSIQKVFLQSNTARSIKTVMFWVDLSIILKMEWERNGNGLPRSLHFSEQV